MKRFITVFLLIFSTTGFISCLAFDYEKPYQAEESSFNEISGTISNWNEYLADSGLYTTSSGLYVRAVIKDDNNAAFSLPITDPYTVDDTGTFKLTLPEELNSAYLKESTSAAWATGITTTPASGIFLLNTLTSNYKVKIILYNSAGTELFEVILSYINSIVSRKVVLQYASDEATIIGTGITGTTVYETSSEGTIFPKGWSLFLIMYYDMGSYDQYQLYTTSENFLYLWSVEWLVDY